MYVYIYIYMYIYKTAIVFVVLCTGGEASRGLGSGLHTILPLPMLYGVWHTQGGSVGGAYIAQLSCNSIATG